jgi:hypothetical protein
MNADFQIILRVVATGVGATIVLDLWSAYLNRFFHIPSTNWAMVGRWFGHLPRGRFVHSKIADVSPVRGELLLGWSAHYAIGVGFATILVAICGLDWLRQPTVVPALLVGVFTVVFPFFLMQPAMGLGSRLPRLQDRMWLACGASRVTQFSVLDCMPPAWCPRCCSGNSFCAPFEGTPLPDKGTSTLRYVSRLQSLRQIGRIDWLK